MPPNPPSRRVASRHANTPTFSEKFGTPPPRNEILDTPLADPIPHVVRPPPSYVLTSIILTPLRTDRLRPRDYALTDADEFSHRLQFEAEGVL